MTSLEAALRQVHTDLTEAHVSFALVGGLAVSALVRVASPAELERTRQSLALIAARGYHRGRDLVFEMNKLLRVAP